jgi:hypothetical protein
MNDAINVLQMAGEIASWTVWLPDESVGEGLARPPILTWKYKQSSDELAAVFRRALDTFPGTLAWEFSAEGPRWYLMPARISEYASEHDLGQLAAGRELQTEEPDFGIRANRELSSLVRHIQDHLEAHVLCENVERGKA